MYSEMIYFKELGKYNPPKISFFKSEIISFYVFIRPKIVSYTKRIRSKSQISDYEEFLDFMDACVDNPSQMNIYNTIEAFKWLIQFCEDYELTTTTHRTISRAELD
jgi:hypothetical protein